MTKSSDLIPQAEGQPSLVLPIQLHDFKRIKIQVKGDNTGLEVSVDGQPLEGLWTFAISLESSSPVIKLIQVGDPFNAMTRERREITFTRLTTIAIDAEVIA